MHKRWQVINIIEKQVHFTERSVTVMIQVHPTGKQSVWKVNSTMIDLLQSILIVSMLTEQHNNSHVTKYPLSELKG